MTTALALVPIVIACYLLSDAYRLSSRRRHMRSITTMIKRFLASLAGLLLALGIATVAFAQNATVVGVPISPNSPVAAGHPTTNNDYGTLMTLSVYSISTVQSALYPNYDGKGLDCTLVQTSHSGSPSTSFSIQEYDAASGTYATLITNASALTADNTPQHIIAYPGVAVSSLPTGFSAQSIHVGPQFRISLTQASATATLNGVVGCAKLR